jgi:hypothetical protein
MPLESSFTYISDLVATNPAVGDNVSVGDDHIRGIKATILATFPNITGAITATHTELNFVDGVTSAVQTQLNALASVTITTKNASDTLALTDAGTCWMKTNTSAYAWTIPPNGTIAFPIGTVVQFYNNGSSGSITVTRGSGVVLRLAGNGTDANRTLTARGLCFVEKVAADEWVISGAGVS